MLQLNTGSVADIYSLFPNYLEYLLINSIQESKYRTSRFSQISRRTWYKACNFRKVLKPKHLGYTTEELPVKYAGSIEKFCYKYNKGPPLIPS